MNVGSQKLLAVLTAGTLLTGCFSDAPIEASGGSSLFSGITFSGSTSISHNITSIAGPAPVIYLIGTCTSSFLENLEISHDNGVTWYSPSSGDNTCGSDLSVSISLPSVTMSGGATGNWSDFLVSNGDQKRFLIRTTTVLPGFSSSVSEVTVSYNSTNTDPAITASCGASVNQDSSYSCSPSLTDPDVGDSHTWSLDSANDCLWMAIDSSTGQLNGFPIDSDVGSCTLAFKVTDSATNTSSVVTQSITVNNVAPTLSISNVTSGLNEDSVYTNLDFDIEASEEGQGSYSLDSSVPGPRCSDSGALSITNSADGIIQFTPNANYNGTCNVGIIFNDQNGLPNSTVNASFSITVSPVNDAPVISGTCTSPATVGTSYSCTPSVSDPDMPNVQTWSFAAGHTCGAWLSINSTTGAVSGTPAYSNIGSCTLAVQSNDGTINSNILSFAVSVTGSTPFVWTGLGSDNNWSTPGNWSTGVVPGPSNVASFLGAACSSNCSPTINSALSLRGITTDSTYTGTINLGVHNLTVTEDINILGGTFDAGITTVEFNGSTPSSVNINGANIYNLRLKKNGAHFQTLSDITVTNSLHVDCTYGGWNINEGAAGTKINALGNIQTFGPGTCGSGTGKVNIAGSITQDINISGPGQLPNIEINKSSGVVRQTSPLIIASSNFNFISGTWDMNGFNLSVNNLNSSAGTRVYKKCAILNSVTSAIAGSIYNGTYGSAISVADATVTEGGTLSFAVSVSPTNCESTNFNFATADGTAYSSDSDYTSVGGGSGSVPVGGTVTVTVNTTPDIKYENDETIILDLSSISSGVIENDISAEGIITNDDPQPIISVSNSIGLEDSIVSFYVRLSAPSGVDTTFNWNIVSPMSATPDDYLQISPMSIVIPAGNISTPISLRLTRDSTAEPMENFSLQLHSITNANYDNVLGIGEIIDLDTNLKLWLDAQDPTTLYSGSDCSSGPFPFDNSQIGCWKDKSYFGGINATQTNFSNMPILRNTVTPFKNQPALDFNGGGMFLNFNQNILNNTNYTVFAVVHRIGSNSNNFFIGTQSTADDKSLHFGFLNNTTIRLGHDFNTGNYVQAPISASNTTGVFVGKIDGSGKFVKFNSYEYYLGSSPNALLFPGQGVIGKGNSTAGFDGQIAEIIIFDQALSTFEIDKIQSYLKYKWICTPPMICP